MRGSISNIAPVRLRSDFGAGEYHQLVPESAADGRCKEAPKLANDQDETPDSHSADSGDQAQEDETSVVPDVRHNDKQNDKRASGDW